jgi:hypothetical protein
LLAAITGVTVADGFPVKFGGGVSVGRSFEGAEGVHAERRNNVERRTIQPLRKSDILIGD